LRSLLIRPLLRLIRSLLILIRPLLRLIRSLLTLVRPLLRLIRSLLTLVRPLLILVRPLLILVLLLLILIRPLLRLVLPLLILVLSLVLGSILPTLELRITEWPQRRTAFIAALASRCDHGQTQEQDRRGHRRRTLSFRV
jgi:hypothetical protein